MLVPRGPCLRCWGLSTGKLGVRGRRTSLHLPRPRCAVRPQGPFSRQKQQGERGGGPQGRCNDLPSTLPPHTSGLPPSGKGSSPLGRCRVPCRWAWLRGRQAAGREAGCRRGGVRTGCREARGNLPNKGVGRCWGAQFSFPPWRHREWEKPASDSDPLPRWGHAPPPWWSPSQRRHQVLSAGQKGPEASCTLGANSGQQGPGSLPAFPGTRKPEPRGSRVAPTASSHGRGRGQKLPGERRRRKPCQLEGSVPREVKTGHPDLALGTAAGELRKAGSTPSPGPPGRNGAAGRSWRRRVRGRPL